MPEDDGVTIQGVNSLRNESLKPAHSPAPGLHSALNTQAHETKAQAPQRPKGNGDGLQVPSGWPKEVVYITQNLVAPSVPDSIAQRYVLAPSSSETAASDNEISPTPSALSALAQATHNDGRPDLLYTTSIQHQVPVIIHAIDQQTPWCPDSFHSTSRNLTCHPAAGSFGLFAAQDIAFDAFIRPYLGVLHTKADADFYSTYDLSLCHDARLVAPQSDESDDVAERIEELSLEQKKDDHEATALYLDSRYWGNESRFVNDYRGIAAKPNVDFRSFVQLTEDGQHRFQMGLFATKPIKKGQELLINYGKSYWVHHDQLEQMKRKDTQAASMPSKQEIRKEAPTKAVDPIQAMLQRSRMRVSRTAPGVQRPPHQPPSPRT